MVDISKVIYRLAEESDYLFVEEMVLDLVEELNLSYEIDTIKNNLQMLLKLPNFDCYVAVDGHPIGCAGFITAPELWNGSKLVSYESFWYVVPEYRKGIGKELVNFVENNISSDIIEFGIAHPALQRMMESNGYSVVKSLMRKEI